VLIVHNSSLTVPAFGSTEPNPASLNKKTAPSPAVNEQDNNGTTRSASTPEQIQAAVAQTGLTKEIDFSQGNDRRTNQALQAYSQTRNQPVQAQLDNLIVRVDYYA